MATFEIEGKEYELKLDYAAVSRLSNLYEGGAYELIGKAIAGNLELFPIVVHAALFHTGENFALKTVNQAIEDLFNSEKLTFEDVSKILDKVVTQSFFFATTVKRLMKDNPEAAEQLAALRA